MLTGGGVVAQSCACYLPACNLSPLLLVPRALVVHSTGDKGIVPGGQALPMVAAMGSVKGMQALIGATVHPPEQGVQPNASRVWHDGIGLDPKVPLIHPPLCPLDRMKLKEGELLMGVEVGLEALGNDAPARKVEARGGHGVACLWDALPHCVPVPLDNGIGPLDGGECINDGLQLGHHQGDPSGLGQVHPGAMLPLVGEHGGGVLKHMPGMDARLKWGLIRLLLLVCHC